MKRNKKAFTLIELLAVIIILAVIALIATPVVLNIVENARKQANKNSAYGILDAAKLYYMESLLDTSKQGNINGTTNLIDEIKVSGNKPATGKGYVYINNSGETAIAIVYDKICYKKNFNENEITESDDIDNCKVEDIKVAYKEAILNGADPVISSNSSLVPVTLESNGTVKKASIYEKWYDYTNKEWANAVILKDSAQIYNDGDIIENNDIDGYFVWIPRYKYEIFDEGNYTEVITVDSAPTESAAQEINIVFESKDVAPSTGSYLTHPAFTTLDVNGLWVAKFETSGDTNDINVLPNVESLTDINVKTMFELAYNYDRASDSHMMKNTEWGAVAYLSHSKYGINEEIRINNSSTYTTGCAATTPALNYVGVSETDGSEGYFAGCENAYNTETGVLASTTGNITGIYDMSGGAFEYMSSFLDGIYEDSGFDFESIAIYDSKYFDVYPSSSTVTSYNNGILGDATGELGPFYSYKDSDNYARYHSVWYSDSSFFIDSSCPWFIRGGYYYSGVVSGLFSFSRDPGSANSGVSFRLVLVD